MALIENKFWGVEDKVAIAIERLQEFEPAEGYYLAFSGGKDSQTIYHLAQMAGVKFDAHYHLTTVDPPELVYFIREQYPDVIIDRPEKTMWELVEKKGFPTRLARWCCSELKEGGGEGRITVTGVRWAESNARRQRKPLEIVTKKKADKMLFDDNDEGRRMFENCTVKGKRVVNPIIDWQDVDVWEFINVILDIPYCKLYDEGFTRLGCIGCPIAQNQRLKHFERWPKYKGAYMRAFARYFPGYLSRCAERAYTPKFQTLEAAWAWWLEDHDPDPDQTVLFE